MVAETIIALQLVLASGWVAQDLGTRYTFSENEGSGWGAGKVVDSSAPFTDKVESGANPYGASYQ